jgi:hypothetical protein
MQLLLKALLQRLVKRPRREMLAQSIHIGNNSSIPGQCESCMSPAYSFDVFLSHSSHDKPVVRALAERLRDDGLRVWFDEWEIKLGDAIPSAIDAGLGQARHLIFCMSHHSLGSDWVLLEAQTLRFRDPMNRQRRLLPVLLDDSPIPDSWQPFKNLDWRTPNAAAYAELLVACGGGKAVAPAPDHAVTPVVDIDRIIKYAPGLLLGREDETALLNHAWHQAQHPAADQPRPHLLTFVALGGSGKTSLVAHWLLDLAGKGWPGCEAVFGWSFYSQGSEQRAASSSELFIDAALRFFGEHDLANSPVGGEDKAKRLAQVVAKQRALLVLDGVEPLQQPPSNPLAGELVDKPLACLLRTLAMNNRGLCVLTTRYSIPDLKAFRARSAPEHALARLSLPAGVDLLGQLGVRGQLDEVAQLVEDLHGHALTLHLFGSYLREAHAGDIRQRGRVHIREADAKEQGGHAFRVMDAYASWFASPQAGADGPVALALLRLMGLFERPASADCLAALWQGEPIAGLTDALFLVEAGTPAAAPQSRPIERASIDFALTRLEQTRLLTQLRTPDGSLAALDAHPLVREYFAERLKTGQNAAWQEAHRRLYCHLRDHTKDKDEPTLADLQPLYQAVVHGCWAGMAQEVFDELYWQRIRRGEQAYSVKKLGAFGTELAAVACFFTRPWQQLAPGLRGRTQGWLLNEAALCLRALGRLLEAGEPVRASLALAVKAAAWNNASTAANNLSQLQLLLGELPDAVQDGALAVEYAVLSKDKFRCIISNTVRAEALHQAGNTAEASTLFAAAEALQAEAEPGAPLLYSLRGFQYAEWLLAGAELAAWQGREHATALAAAHDVCAKVQLRATQTLAWVTQRKMGLLTIALHQLTLSRVALYGALLQAEPLAACQPLLEQALVTLRRAGSSHHLPRGLLSRAWAYASQARYPAAQADLDEAFAIAERGPMPLFLAEIHLHRAHLFHALPEYPWHSAQHDLAEARRLIEQHGYLRRLPFLQATEARILPPQP